MNCSIDSLQWADRNGKVGEFTHRFLLLYILGICLEGLAQRVISGIRYIELVTVQINYTNGPNFAINACNVPFPFLPLSLS